MLENVMWLAKYYSNKRSKLSRKNDQTYETFALNSYMLISSIHFSIIENMKSDSPQISGTIKAIYAFVPFKLLKHFTFIVSC